MRLVYLLLFLLATPVVAQPTIHSLDAPTAARIDALFADWSGPDTPGGAVGVMRGGALVYAQGYGVADLEYGTPNTAETVFLIASVSKQMTAFAAALLADQGVLDLDADIRTYVPELPDYGTPITLRHLVHHTSGLRDEFELFGLAGYRNDDVITRELLLDLAFRQSALNFPPGSEYLYCNTGYTLIAEIIERETGEPFRAWMDANLYQPLGMTTTHVHDDYGEVDRQRAQGYSRAAEGWVKSVYAYESVGASGVFTTVHDLARWAHNMETGQVGGAAVLETVHRRGVLISGDTLTYAFGQGHGVHKGHRRVAHGGWHRGFRSYLLRFPDDDLTVIVLANTDAFSPSDQALAVADVFLTPGPEALAEYVGTYHSADVAATYEVAIEGRGLVLRHRRHGNIPLSWEGRDRFSATQEFLEHVTFTREGGRLNGFTAASDRIRGIRFDRLLAGGHTP